MAKIKFFALGGLGENGKNMYVVEVNDRIFILDAGVKYPDIDMYGVDAVIADMSYLVENKDRIEGVFISHGHEDHIRALPYLLKLIPTRIYGTHFTICLIENLLTDHKMNIKNYKLFRINENKVLTFGKDVSVSFFNTTHSIPESVAISINTEDGSIVYCTDFIFGPTNFGKYQTSFDKITDLGRNNVLALLTESVGAGTTDRTKNDSLLEHNYKNVLINSNNRIVISAYSSDLNRIQQIINMSVEKGRKIALVGKKTERIVDIAVKSNYLSIPKENLVSLKPISDENPERVDDDLVVIVTGIRNEPYTILVKMALGENEYIKLRPTDTTIVMCPLIPGTEKHSIDSLNTLYREDIEAEIFDRQMLRSAHANKDDLKLLYSMVKPKYIIPIKGEHRHLYDQYLVAKEAGFVDDKILMLDNGMVVKFEKGEVDVSDVVKTGDIFVDGAILGIVNEQIIKDRETLSEEGAVIFNINYDSRLRKVQTVSNIVTKGLSYSLSYDELNSKVRELATRMINNSLVKKSFNVEFVKAILEDEIGKITFRITKHRPVIIANLIDISK